MPTPAHEGDPASGGKCDAGDEGKNESRTVALLKEQSCHDRTNHGADTREYQTGTKRRDAILRPHPRRHDMCDAKLRANRTYANPQNDREKELIVDCH